MLKIAITQHNMETHGGVEVQLLLIHDLMARWEWSLPRSGHALLPLKDPSVPTA
jgi:hypothetical protein